MAQACSSWRHLRQPQKDPKDTPESPYISCRFRDAMAGCGWIVVLPGSGLVHFAGRRRVSQGKVLDRILTTLRRVSLHAPARRGIYAMAAGS